MSAIPSPIIKAALIDLNGTLHIGNQAIPNSIAALQRLRDAGVLVRFVSNTSKDTTAALINQVQAIGFDIPDPSHVFTSIGAARALVARRQLRPLLLLQPQAAAEFAGMALDPPHNAVVVGLAKDEFNYANMNKALQVLLDNPGAPLIAMHKGRLFKDPSGALLLGPGPFVAALEYATGHTAEVPHTRCMQPAVACLWCASPPLAKVVGKPTASFFSLALDDLGVAPHEAVMVGDDVRDDVGGAQQWGLRGVLVQTGKYRPGDEAAHGVTPDAMVADFAAAVDWILAHRGAV